MKYKHRDVRVSTARAGRRYEQTLDGEHRGDILLIYWNPSTYLLNPDQLRLHPKCKTPAVELHEAAVAGPSTYPQNAKNSPFDENVFEAHAFDGDEGM